MLVLQNVALGDSFTAGFSDGALFVKDKKEHIPFIITTICLCWRWRF
jgi:hypothetical protein